MHRVVSNTTTQPKVLKEFCSMTATDTALKPAIYAATAAAHPGLPTLHGVPWPQGDLQPDGAVAVRTPAGNLRPASMHPLVSWPDGSVRWGLIEFNATEVGCHVVESGSADAPANAVATTVADDSVVLDNGLVRVELANTGPGPIRKLTAAHHDYLTAPEQFRLAVDDASTLNESERSIKVITDSPLRTRVRVEGAHYKTDGSRCLSYRLDVELWAAPKGSNSLSLRLVKPYRPPPWRKVRIRSRRPVRILCG